MISGINYNYECEDCGGAFLILADTDEVVKFCPQCSNSEATFKKIKQKDTLDFTDQNNYFDHFYIDDEEEDEM